MTHKTSDSNNHGDCSGDSCHSIGGVCNGSVSGSFHYDLALALDSDKYLHHVLGELKKDSGYSKVLAVTFDHRFFNIHEKNYIKALIDSYDLNHIMFTLRPSASHIIAKTESLDREKFKKFTQIVLTLQSMARYGINTGLISRRFLLSECFDYHTHSTFPALSVYDEVIAYLDNLLCCLPRDFNGSSMQKIFCSLTSLVQVRDSLADKVIVFQEDILARSEYDRSDIFVYDDQISELEKDIYWVGFDSNYKEVPWDKDYPKTRWNELVPSTKWGAPLYGDELQYCNRCCMPETMEGITFDEFGICTPCRSSEEKMHIDWEMRDKRLRSILDEGRSASYYDCMLPMSGGKDSMFQAYVLRNRYHVNPLAVTHGHNWMSITGRYNLENCLQQFDLDHIMFHANRSIISRAARKSLPTIGDVCWHCHVGAGAFAIQTACYWKLGLMIWGESIAERDGRGSYYGREEADLYYNIEISARVKAEDYQDDSMSCNELSHWIYPPSELLMSSKLRYLHLGDFMFWDEERHVDFIVKHFEWRDSKVENTYKGYKSTECVMAGVHDYANFIKRGIGRATVHASDDVRRGLLTREEGMQLSKEYDTQRPHALDYYLALSGYSEEEFEKELVKARSISKDASKLKRE